MISSSVDTCSKTCETHTSVNDLHIKALAISEVISIEDYVSWNHMKKGFEHDE